MMFITLKMVSWLRMDDKNDNIRMDDKKANRMSELDSIALAKTIISICVLLLEDNTLTDKEKVNHIGATAIESIEYVNSLNDDELPGSVEE